MKARFSRLALGELNAILENIAANDPAAAARFEHRVQRIVERIGQFPDSAQEVVERPGVRRVPLVRYPYAIYYKIMPEEVTILRVVHGARRDPFEDL